MIAVLNGIRADAHAWANGDATAHATGEVVYLAGDGTARRARADAAATTGALALAAGPVAAGAVGPYQASGPLPGLAGLTVGATYWLDPAIAGAMTTTAPTAAGQHVVELGVAVGPTEFQIRVRPPILL
jgi:hypothetical protein